MLFDHILVTTDLSQDSFVAFDIACYQAKFNNSRITLLSVFKRFQLSESVSAFLGDEQQVAQMRAAYEEEMIQKIESLAKERFHGYKVTTKVIFSDENPGQAITAYAEEEFVNLIVLAAHGASTHGNPFMGSVAQRIIKNAMCPVIIIPKIED